MRYFKTLLITCIIVTITSCARRGRPEGGPKDETAPIMVTAKPPHETINFNEEKIRIYFDEYIVLKNLNKQLVVSPPMKNPPLIMPQGSPSKYISIKILDTLKPNTTYSFNFGNAVQDNNENNKLESFKYVFSTGNYIDSLNVKGSVVDAYKKETEKGINVLLYKMDSTYTDSIVYKRKPDYVANTLDSTLYNITNIRKGKYLLIALKENAGDFIFSSKNDKIGFYDTPIELPKDSIINTPIRFFKETQPFKFKRGKEVTKGKIQFGFNGKQENMKVKLLSKTPDNYKSFTQFETDKDTLNYWFTPFEADSLNFIVSNKEFLDTITVRLRKKKIDSLSITTNLSRFLHLNDTLFLKTNNPITSFDKTKFSLIDKDTVDVAYELLKTDINKLAVLFKKKYTHGYNLKVLPKGLTGIYKTSNDTLNYKFYTKEIEDYGKIILDIKKETKHPVIIELLQKDKVLKRQYLNESKTISFDLLEPKEYHIRAIIDENDNKQWDTGNFLQRKQPETIIYFNIPFKLKPNWHQEEVFIIK